MAKTGDIPVDEDTIRANFKVKWTKWYAWRDLKPDRGKSRIKLPYDRHGVYEVRKKGAKKRRLFIGWSY